MLGNEYGIAHRVNELFKIFGLVLECQKKHLNIKNYNHLLFSIKNAKEIEAQLAEYLSLKRAPFLSSQVKSYYKLIFIV